MDNQKVKARNVTCDSKIIMCWQAVMQRGQAQQRAKYGKTLRGGAGISGSTDIIKVKVGEQAKST